MNARSALLVAFVAVLFCGAIWLARGIERRPQRASGAPDRADSAQHAEPEGSPQTKSAVARKTAPSRRVTVAESEPEPVAASAPPKPVQILVVRSRTKAADIFVPNARVEIVDTGAEDERPRWEVTAKGETDASGLFSFEAARSFAATVRTEANIDGRKLYGSGSVLLPRVTSEPVVIRLSDEPRRELRVTVLDRGTLRPIAGAEVRSNGDFEPTTTNALGEFGVWVTDGPVASAVHVWIGESAHFPVTWRAWHGPTDKPVVYMHATARLAGRLQNAAGAAVEGAELRTYVHMAGDSSYAGRDVSALTDQHGRFEFETLPAALALWFSVRRRGESIQCDVPVIRLEPGEAREITLLAGGHVELTGRVLDVTDALVRSGNIRIEIDGRSDSGSIRSDGTYYLPFAVAGAGWISVLPEGEKNEVVVPLRVPIVVPSSVTEWTYDVRLVPSSSITGVFQDDDGRPVRSGEITLVGAATPKFDPRSVDARGAFRFDSVPPGEYTLTARETKGAQRSLRVDVHAGDQGLVLRLPEKGYLRGRVVHPSAKAVASAYVYVQGEAANERALQGGRDGTFRIPSSVGSYWIWAVAGGGQSRYEHVSVEAGRETAVPDLVIAPTAQLRLVTGNGERMHVEISDAAGPYLALDLEPFAERVIQVPVGAVDLVVTSAGQTAKKLALLVQRDEVVHVPLSGEP